MTDSPIWAYFGRTLDECLAQFPPPSPRKVVQFAYYPETKEAYARRYVLYSDGKLYQQAYDPDMDRWTAWGEICLPDDAKEKP